MADGDALHIARTKAFSAVGVRKHSKNFFTRFPPALAWRETFVSEGFRVRSRRIL